MPYLYHQFTSQKPDASDSSLVRPSNWNARFKYGNFANTGPSSTDALVREILTANRTYFVSTTGSDTTGDGSAGNPWQTLDKANGYLEGIIDAAGFRITIQLADGTYSSTYPGQIPNCAAFIVQGNTSDASKVVIQDDGYAAFDPVEGGRMQFVLRWLTVQQVNGGYPIVMDCQYGILLVANCIVDCGASGCNTGVFVQSSNICNFGFEVTGAQAPNTIKGNSNTFFGTNNGCSIVHGGPTVVSGAPNYANAFLSLSGGSTYVEGSSYTNPTNATGKRFILTDSSLVGTDGTGFPGSIVGTYNPRQMATATINYFVRKDGNDNNNGLANTAGGAFLTIGRAISVVTGLDTGDNNINIQVGAGTYTENNEIGDLVGMASGVVKIFPETTATIDGQFYVIAGSPWQWDIAGFTQQNTAGGSCYDIDGGWISIGTTTWGVCTGSGNHVNVHNGGQSWQYGNDTISGGANSHWNSASRGICRHRGCTITLTGTPAFTSAFAFGNDNGDMQVDGNTFTGAATGPRFFMGSGSRIKTNSLSLTYFPGSTPGLFTSGFYGDSLVVPTFSAPVTLNAATLTIDQTMFSVIGTNAGTMTLTLLNPAGATFIGRTLLVKTTVNQTMVSASANVVPLAGGAAGTAILAATAGKWALLQSDGTNWVIMAGA